MFEITEKKHLILILKIFSIMCILAIVTCLIIDIAANRGLTWSPCVMFSILFAWLAALPALILKNRKFIMFMALVSILTLPYLLGISVLLGGNWFGPVGMPIGSIGVAVMWLVYFVIHYLRVNPWYKAAVIVLIGNICNAAATMIINIYTRNNILRISDIISLIAVTAVTVLLFIIGSGKIPGKKEDMPVIDVEAVLLEDSETEKKEE